MSEKEVKEISKGVSGVVELYRLNGPRAKGPPVSIGQVIDQLATPRNLAVHAGEAMDHDTAEKAVRTAKALLEVTPLASPGAAAG